MIAAAGTRLQLPITQEYFRHVALGRVFQIDLFMLFPPVMCGPVTKP